MKKETVIFCAALTASIFTHANAQNGVVQDNVVATNAIDAFINYTVSPGYLLYGIPEASGGVVGTAYLFDDWRKIVLKLNGQDKEFTIQESKINLYSNQIEINHNNSIRAIDISKVEKFLLSRLDASTQKSYVSASAYKIEGTPQVGVLEIMVDGSIPLIKKTKVTIKQPDYNIQLNVGSKNTRILKEDIYYIVKDGELKNLKTIKNKKFSQIFGGSASAMTKFMQDNSLRLSEEDDLVLIFKHYNQEVIK